MRGILILMILVLRWKLKSCEISNTLLNNENLPDFDESSQQLSNLTIHHLTRTSERACENFGPPAQTRYKRIIGGIPAEENEFPQFASLGVRIQASGKIRFECGGTLISEKFVLSAAHCAEGCCHSKTCIVRLGKNSVDALEDFETDYLVQNVSIHPNYRINGSDYNDIGILELSRSVEFNSKIWPACLSQQKLAIGHPLKVAGFGRISIINSIKRSDELLKATLFEVPLDECRERYKETLKGERKNIYGLPEGILDTQLCAQSRGKHADTCQGDSGAGIFMFSKRSYHIVGITSFGLGCDSPLPSFYTRVYEYLPWIEDIVWPNFNNST